MSYLDLGGQAELEQLRADCARYRALIKDAERNSWVQGDACCPWCDSAAFEGHGIECKAFTPRGDVK